MDLYSALVLCSILLPLAAGLLACRREWLAVLRYSLPLLPLPALLLALLSINDSMIELPWLLEGAKWGLDELRRAFLMLSAILWSLAGLFAVGYQHEPGLRRFCTFWALTLSGNLGLIVAQDIASFYSFFALMTFAAYGLVVHAGTVEANRAGRVYLAMAVLGEMGILVGLLMAAYPAGATLLAELPTAISNADQAGLIMALLFLGFGIKAGLPLLHFWLPLAHPVAPTPASAVLSGSMIKAGALGWLLTLPFGELDMPAWADLMVVTGAVASLGAAALGLRQTRPKTVLAYSSISQMGLITLLIGGAFANAARSEAVIAVVALYVLHHGLAKCTLFLSTAMKLPASRSGRWLTWLLIALPGLSLAGLPFTSGAVSKLAMKNALAPENFDFALAPYFPGLMSAGAVATLLLIWRFIWTAHLHAKVGVNSLWQWSGWGLATAASLAVFWYLPWHAALPELKWLSLIERSLWSLVWPMLAATIIAAIAWTSGRSAARDDNRVARP